MILFPKYSSGIAAVVGPLWPLDSGFRPSGLETSDRDLPSWKMNDPFDTYASCMQDQLNRYPATTMTSMSASIDTVQCSILRALHH